MAKNRNYEKPREDISEKEDSDRDDYRDSDYSGKYGYKESKKSDDKNEYGNEIDLKLEIDSSNQISDNDSVEESKVGYKDDGDDHGPDGYNYPGDQVNPRSVNIAAEVKTGSTSADGSVDDTIYKETDTDVGAYGSESASGSVKTNVEAFNQDLSTGYNVQFNEATLSVIVEDSGNSDSDKMISDYSQRTNRKTEKPDNDKNDLDDIGKVSSDSDFEFDDFGDNSLNQFGNEMSYDVSQSNSLIDDDRISNPSVVYHAGDPAVFSLSAMVNTDDTSSASNVPSVGGPLTVEEDAIGGSVSAESTVVTYVEAFTQYISLGENIQLNSIDVSMARGDTLLEDDPQMLHKVQEDEGSDYGSPKTSSKPSDSDGDDHSDIVDLAAGGDHIVFDDFVDDSHVGEGNDMSFDFDQVNSLQDNDYVSNPEVVFGGEGDFGGTGDGVQFSIGANVNTGDNSSSDSLGGNYDSAVGFNTNEYGDATGAVHSQSDVVTNVEAFTQSIVMGANVQANTVELTIVGDDKMSSGDDIDSLG